ncbi:MAG: 50S ribosomal protein L11 methyltransferase, partial [Thermodesulfobacteriota bacterium]
PSSLSGALEKLRTKVKGAQDWMDLVSTIVHLYEAGVLRDETQNKPTFRADPSGYDSAPIHVAMLNDRVRTSSFLAGIYEVVRPGDIVVDIGTGTGILAIAAARAGARHVYAIEASGIWRLAKALFESNGVADRITLLEGWSTQINLPEQADVLISEMIGNEPLAENVLEITTDAVKRLLKPDGRLVPNNVKIFGLPVTIPTAELMKHTFITETLQNWKSWYGIDFNPLSDAIRNSPHAFFINSFSARDWKILSEPILLASIDLKNVSQLTIDNTITATTNALGQLNGLFEYFELELGLKTRLSTHPSHVNADNHWRSPVWVFIEPLSLNTGDQFAVTYRYRVTEDKVRVSVARI